MPILGFTRSKVWLDGEDVEITGVLPIADDAIVHTQSLLHRHNTPKLPFALRLKVGR